MDTYLGLSSGLVWMFFWNFELFDFFGYSFEFWFGPSKIHNPNIIEQIVFGIYVGFSLVQIHFTESNSIWFFGFVLFTHPYSNLFLLLYFSLSLFHLYKIKFVFHCKQKKFVCMSVLSTNYIFLFHCRNFLWLVLSIYCISEYF